MENDRQTETNATREGEGERGCGGTREVRTSDIVKGPRFIFHLPLLKCKCIPPIERCALLLFMPLPLWCDVFSVLPAFLTLTVIVIQPSKSGTDKQEGNTGAN